MFRLALVAVATTTWQGAEGKTFRYAVLGDWGTGGDEAGSPHESTSASAYRDTVQEHDTQFTISTGDNIYCDVNYGIQHSWEGTWKKPGSHGGGPWLMTIGNHDNAGPQQDYSKKSDAWVFPSSFFTKEIDTGLNFTIQIWSVNTHSFGNDQLEWLENSLKASTARWKIIFTHYPWISSGRHKKIAPPITVAALAKKYNVQTVYSGHDHILQSMVHEGVLFVGSGATARGAMLFRGQGQENTDFLWAWGLTFSVGYHGIVHVSVSKNVLWGHMYSRANLVHEFITVWDWPLRFRDLCESDRKESCLPSAKTIVHYLNEEADAHPTVVSETGETEAPTPTPTNAGEVKLANDSDVVKVTTEQVISAPTTVTADTAEKRAVYVVATLCEMCLGATMNREFSVWIQGVALNDNHKVVVAHVAADCENAGRSGNLVNGETNTKANIATFTVSGQASWTAEMYVCLSADAGKTFNILTAADTGFNTFPVYAEPAPDAGPLRVSAPPAGEVHKLKQRLHSLISSFKTSDESSTVGGNGGVSWSWVAILMAVCGVAAWYKGRTSARAEARRTLSSVTQSV